MTRLHSYRPNTKAGTNCRESRPRPTPLSLSSQAMAEEEVMIEVEAVEAVYGDDCKVINNYPPHLHVHIKPRTADVSSQQFVEAIVEIRAGPQYPDEPPHISIVDSKGLDEERQRHLITSIHDKACELSSYLMIVALCEEAVERLSSMNHPEGDCPLCLSPLLGEGAGDRALPFMKLMSCFHCFHCECIFRWWNWLRVQKETDHARSSGSTLRRHGMETQLEMHEQVEESMGTCPVCRKVFHSKDIEHVLDLVEAYSELSLTDAKVDDHDEKLLHSDSEKVRRQKFEDTLKLQQENSGLIEPKKTEVLMPGMFLPRPVPTNPTPLDEDTSKQQPTDPAAKLESNTSSSSNKSSTSSSGMRRHHRSRNYSRPQVKMWARKENNTVNYDD